jgi:hypothetical protein
MYSKDETYVRHVRVVLAIALMVSHLHGQTWVMPRTPWGDPDLQGNWTSVDMLGVPLQRPVELGERSAFSDEEFANVAHRQRAGTQNDDILIFGDSTSHWYDNGRPQRQTSLIVDPPNGRFPSLTAEGAKKLASRPSEDRGPMAGPEDATLLARCVSRGPWSSMLPLGSNNANQILQAPGLVVIRNELVHETRVVPVDGRPHVGADVRSYMGDSRGRWQGNTLVVETTNFNNKDTFSLMSQDARLIERLTRIDATTLGYEATVDDPHIWTRPFTVALPLRQDPSYAVYEYACHEGNHLNMRSMLTAARLEDR